MYVCIDLYNIMFPSIHVYMNTQLHMYFSCFYVYMSTRVHMFV